MATPQQSHTESAPTGALRSPRSREGCHNPYAVQWRAPVTVAGVYWSPLADVCGLPPNAQSQQVHGGIDNTAVEAAAAAAWAQRSIVPTAQYELAAATGPGPLKYEPLPPAMASIVRGDALALLDERGGHWLFVAQVPYDVKAGQVAQIFKDVAGIVPLEVQPQHKRNEYVDGRRMRNGCMHVRLRDAADAQRAIALLSGTVLFEGAGYWRAVWSSGGAQAIAEHCKAREQEERFRCQEPAMSRGVPWHAMVVERARSGIFHRRRGPSWDGGAAEAPVGVWRLYPPHPQERRGA